MNRSERPVSWSAGWSAGDGTEATGREGAGNDGSNCAGCEGVGWRWFLIVAPLMLMCQPGNNHGECFSETHALCFRGSAMDCLSVSSCGTGRFLFRITNSIFNAALQLSLTSHALRQCSATAQAMLCHEASGCACCRSRKPIYHVPVIPICKKDSNSAERVYQRSSTVPSNACRYSSLAPAHRSKAPLARKKKAVHNGDCKTR